MSIDTLTTTALVDEFNEHLTGGRVQDTVEIERETFGLEIYAHQQRHYLLLSANNQQPRALLAPDKLRRGVQKPSPLGLLLRTRLEGMRLMAVQQPPWERIIEFHFLGHELELRLIIELIERRANLILVADNTILECARRIGPDDNRYRIILPQREYVPPPPFEDQIEPDDLTPQALDSLLRRDPGQKAWLTLVRGIYGFSPLLGKEIVYRAHKDPNLKARDANPYTLHAAMTPLLGPLLRHQWQPGVALDENAQPRGLAVFPVSHLAEWQPTESVSAAVNRFFGDPSGPAAYEAAKEPVRKQLAEALSRARSKLYNLEQQTVDKERIETLRQSGEMVLAYQYTMQPDQTVLEAHYHMDEPPLRIPLDPDLTPLENAQRYFEKYEKAKRAAKRIPLERYKARRELEYLEQLEADLELAENWPEIGEVQDELQKGGYWQGKKTAQPSHGKSAPLKFVTEEGFVIWLGRNARQNEIVTFDRAASDDLWLHARDIAGSHVIIKTQGQEVPPHVIEQAAQLAAYYSKARDENKVLVQMAYQKHLQKMKGGKPGQVTIREELPGITVTPDKPLEEG